MLEDAGFLEGRQDAIRRGRPTHHVVDPFVRFHHAVLRLRWGELERPGAARRLWPQLQPTFTSQVLGPAFEELCRTWTSRFADPETLGGVAGLVGQSVLNDRVRRATHELDVVVLGARDRSGRVPLLALGEAKLGQRLDEAAAARLRRARGLLADRFDTRGTRLLWFGASMSRRQQRTAPGIEVVDLQRLYHGS